MFTRRQFGFTGVGAAIVGFVNGSARASEKFEISKSDADWQRILSKEQFHVLRKHGTAAFQPARQDL
jgi:peptide-methionine (R)-S-oxide reductase